MERLQADRACPNEVVGVVIDEEGARRRKLVFFDNRGKDARFGFPLPHLVRIVGTTEECIEGTVCGLVVAFVVEAELLQVSFVGVAEQVNRHARLQATEEREILVRYGEEHGAPTLDQRLEKGRLGQLKLESFGAGEVVDERSKE